MNENEQKEAGVGHFFKKNLLVILNNALRFWSLFQLVWTNLKVLCYKWKYHYAQTCSFALTQKSVWAQALTYFCFL